MITTDMIGQHALVVLEMVATAAFAISGVLSAQRQRMDVVGICVCGCLAALGGGTLRDLLIDRRPFFWAEHQSTLIGVLMLCIACAAGLKQRQLESSQKLLQVPDAIGLGLFCATGVHLAWVMGQPPMVAMLMGVITGAFGGVLRDMVCNEVPKLFKDHRPYALCALAGGLAYAALSWLEAPQWSRVGACALVTTGSRLLALYFDWRLPSAQGESSEA